MFIFCKKKKTDVSDTFRSSVCRYSCFGCLPLNSVVHLLISSARLMNVFECMIARRWTLKRQFLTKTNMDITDNFHWNKQTHDISNKIIFSFEITRVNLDKHTESYLKQNVLFYYFFKFMQTQHLV